MRKRRSFWPWVKKNEAIQLLQKAVKSNMHFWPDLWKEDPLMKPLFGDTEFEKIAAPKEL